MTYRYLLLCMLAIGIFVLSSSTAVAQQSDRLIEVWGHNTQSKAPTILRIDLTTLAIGPSAAEAVEHAGVKAEEIINEFRQFGLEPKDWSEHRALARKPLPDEPKRLVFWATVTLTVRLSDFTAAGQMLDQANAMKVAGIHFQFELDDPAAIYEMAMERAVDDAKRRAQVLAREMSVTLGSVVGCEEISTAPIQNVNPSWVESDSDSLDESPSPGIFPFVGQRVIINPLPIEVDADVRVRFAITR